MSRDSYRRYPIYIYIYTYILIPSITEHHHGMRKHHWAFRQSPDSFRHVVDPEDSL